ncbi:hypothetical protein F5Y05DRAFT_166985 [Hypoxylon sp. FL0543]|nr:hypothetical protein F5Y05DRAFT_166985 [Hypoxylon sp. FL0543]
MGVVYTTCLNYNVYSEYSVGPRTGCCMDPYLPYCAWNTYTGSEIEGFTIIQCGETYYPSPLHLAWDASTSGQSPTTMYVGLPTTGASTPASESTDKPTTPITPTPTPTDSPGGLSTSDKITLGTTLGLGLPATIAGIIGAWYGYKAWVNKKREDSGGGYASVANTLGDESMFSKPADQGQAGSRLLRMTS